MDEKIQIKVLIIIAFLNNTWQWLKDELRFFIGICACRWYRRLEEPFHCGWQWIVWSFPGQMDCSQGDTIQILDIHGADSNTSSEKTIDLLIIIISKSMEKTKDCDECLQFLQYCHFYNKYNRTALNWHKHYNINYVPFTLCTYTLVLQNGHVPLPQFLTPNFLSCYLTTQNYAIKQKTRVFILQWYTFFKKLSLLLCLIKNG